MGDLAKQVLLYLDTGVLTKAISRHLLAVGTVLLGREAATDALGVDVSNLYVHVFVSASEDAPVLLLGLFR